MGTTYSNCQVRSDSQESVVAALTGLLKEPAYVAPAVNGWVGAYPEGDGDAAERLAKKLSAKLSCGVFYWSVYDSDIFYYTLYEDGKKRDEFDSNPDYFETVSAAKKARLRGKPEALVAYCLPGIGYAQVKEVLQPPLSDDEDTGIPLGESALSEKLLLLARLLNPTPGAVEAEIAETRRRKYVFADEQASDLAKMLGIDEALVALCYQDIEAEQTGDHDFATFGLMKVGSAEAEFRRPTKPLSSAQQMYIRAQQRDDWGVPSLVVAARICHPNSLQELLSDGYDVNLAVDTSSLRLQQNNSSPALAKRLEDAVRGRYGDFYENGFTALMAAAGASSGYAERQLETVQVLLNAGADVDVRSETGRTALSEAIQQRAEQIVEMLRAAGATE